MQFADFAAEIVPVVVYTLVAAVLTVGGMAAEYSSLQHFGGGELVVAAWLAILGAVMLYTGLYAIGYQKLLARAMAR